MSCLFLTPKASLSVLSVLRFNLSVVLGVGLTTRNVGLNTIKPVITTLDVWLSNDPRKKYQASEMHGT